jgi:glycosyltransferase involved in cell wall biosynthesis
MESYGLVVAESLAHGTPCIVSKTSALTEFLNEPGCFGVDYPPDDEALAKLILDVSASEVEVSNLSRKVRVWDEVAEDYVRVYRGTM